MMCKEGAFFCLKSAWILKFDSDWKSEPEEELLLLLSISLVGTFGDSID